jgi:DNA-binding NtrC family response regulator
MISDRHILFVEDDVSFALALQTVLSVYNSLRITRTIAETRRALAEDVSFDLVLLDKTLPDGDGTDLVTEIRSRFPSAPIIILTGDSDFRAVTQCIRRGADDYVLKSGQILQDLLARIPVATAAAAARNEVKASREKVLCELPVAPDDVSAEHYRKYLAELERAYLERSLTLHEGDVAGVAKKLELGRSTLFKKIQDLKLLRRPWTKSIAELVRG